MHLDTVHWQGLYVAWDESRSYFISSRHENTSALGKNNLPFLPGGYRNKMYS